jgi:hypothetical protein
VKPGPFSTVRDGFFGPLDVRITENLSHFRTADTGNNATVGASCQVGLIIKGNSGSKGNNTPRFNSV